MNIIHKKLSKIILGLCLTFDAVYILSSTANATYTLFSLNIYIFELSETFCVRSPSKPPKYFFVLHMYRFVVLVHMRSNSLYYKFILHASRARANDI